MSCQISAKHAAFFTLLALVDFETDLKKVCSVSYIVENTATYVSSCRSYNTISLYKLLILVVKV